MSLKVLQENDLEGRMKMLHLILNGLDMRCTHMVVAIYYFGHRRNLNSVSYVLLGSRLDIQLRHEFQNQPTVQIHLSYEEATVSIFYHLL